jgi:serine phosphatase RsbU (regulator of sigma subunit)
MTDTMAVSGLRAGPDESCDRVARLVRTVLRVPLALVCVADGDRRLLPGAAGLGAPLEDHRQMPLTERFCRDVDATTGPVVVSLPDPGTPPVHIGGTVAAAYAGVPLASEDGQVFGALYAIDDQPHEWTGEELSVLTDLAAGCASELRLRNAATRAAVTAADRVRLEARLRATLRERVTTAETLQRAMLTDLPCPDRLRLTARYHTAHVADQVGGDWYDAFVRPGGDTVAVIGDVAGHDMRAATVMGQLRSMLRAFAVDRREPPARLLERLDLAATALGIDPLVTAVVAGLHPQPDGFELTWSNAGHPPPVLLHPDGSVDLLEGRDPLLGLRLRQRRTTRTATLAPGATLLLYTDGLIETYEDDLRDRIDYLASTVADHAGMSLDAMVDAVVDRFRQPSPADDVAILACRVDPPPTH